MYCTLGTLIPRKYLSCEIIVMMMPVLLCREPRVGQESNDQSNPSGTKVHVSHAPALLHATMTG